MCAFMGATSGGARERGTRGGHRSVVLSARDAPACTLGYVYRGLNSAVHDNGGLCQTVYVQHRTIGIERPDLPRWSAAADRLRQPERARQPRDLMPAGSFRASDATVQTRTSGCISFGIFAYVRKGEVMCVYASARDTL